MDQLTLRGLDRRLEALLRRLARDEGLSLNQAALKLLRRGAGLEEPPARRPIEDELDRYVGGMSAEDAEEILGGAAGARVIDDELWR
ncbi:MAG: hypothetical protein A2138_04650 [Deltaproteobacteria bacterium RBG_16_71_12]|nr:MAG: hypothetical protein A2138_04650 [Deltaproteobacteria bacterium RBG_16_71_12]